MPAAMRVGGSVQGAGRLSTGELSVSLCRSVSALSVVLYNNSSVNVANTTCSSARDHLCNGQTYSCSQTGHTRHPSVAAQTCGMKDDLNVFVTSTSSGHTSHGTVRSSYSVPPQMRLAPRLAPPPPLPCRLPRMLPRLASCFARPRPAWHGSRCLPSP